MTDLDVSFEINTPSGWIELEDPEEGYELHRESFATRSYSHRKTEASNEWTAGEYVTRSVRSNVVEDVKFYVAGATVFQCRTRLDLVLEALHVLSYQARYRMEDYLETWTCSPADFTLESDQPLSAAKLVLVSAKIPRHPVVVSEQVVP